MLRRWVWIRWNKLFLSLKIPLKHLMAPKSVVENVDNNKKEICNIERTFFHFSYILLRNSSRIVIEKFTRMWTINGAKQPNHKLLILSVSIRLNYITLLVLLLLLLDN